MVTRRVLLGTPLWAALGAHVAAQGAQARAEQLGDRSAAGYELPIGTGPFQPTADSLKKYEAPQWFRDGKLGIWAHWGPQAVPRKGDWYARWMYVPGHPHYAHHLEHYGHPSEFGYKDVIASLEGGEVRSRGVDGSLCRGGRQVLRQHGRAPRQLRFVEFTPSSVECCRNGSQAGYRRRLARRGTSARLEIWSIRASRREPQLVVPSHLYDQFWPKMGVNYDGADPQYADLYHPKHEEPFKGNSDTWYTTDPKYHQTWFNRIRDLIDSYEPDLLYSDGGMPFGVVGRSLVAHYFNSSVAKHGRVETVYNCKALGSGEFYPEACVQDVERGVMSGINPLPWQTDTSNGDWYYADGYAYKTGPEVIYMLADIVSKNGNLLLNVVLYPDGSLPPESQTLLSDLKSWMAINAEAIHATRPWAVYGEGPTETAAGAFKENAEYTAQDIRFTTKNETLYAITLGEPSNRVTINSLGRASGPRSTRRGKRASAGRRTAAEFSTYGRRAHCGSASQTAPRHASAFKISFRQ